MLISPAYAQAAGATSQSDTLLTFLPMVAIFVVFYFLLIRPQQKKQKEARAMLESLEKGNEVVTAGGVLGRIVKLDEQYATIEVAPNVQMVVQRAIDLAVAAERHAQSTLGPDEPVPALEVHHHRDRAGVRPHVHAAELFPRSPGRAGVVVEVDGQDRQRAARLHRGSAEGGRRPVSRRGARSRRHQDPLQRPRHAVEGARTCCRPSSATTTSSRSISFPRRRTGWPRSGRCRCTSASTCAAASTSCCRST